MPSWVKKRFVCEAPLIASIDVLVCGGGPAGIAAALAAARSGASTMLIEQHGCLGGVATNSLVGIWLGSYSRDGKFPVIGGIFREILHRLWQEGGATLPEEDVPPQGPFTQRGEPGLIRLGSRHVGYAPWHGRVSAIDFEIFKLLSEKMLLESGVRIRYFTHFVKANMKKNKIVGVYVFSKAGIEYIEAKVVVDATGDADVAYTAGCPTEKGREEDGLNSPVTIMILVNNVKSRKFKKYCEETGDYRLKNIVHKLLESNEWPFNFENIICCELKKRGMFCINALRLTGLDGTNPEDLSQSMIEGREQAAKLFKIMKKYVPGFEKADLIQTSYVPGVRDTRRIVGLYKVTVQDLINGVEFADTIALSGYHWDMPDPKKPSYQRLLGKIELSAPYSCIPYRCMLPKNVSNLIVPGRAISCEWEALGPLRVMPVCFATGQAAGCAAALAVYHNRSLCEISPKILQRMLRKQGAILPPVPRSNIIINNVKTYPKGDDIKL